MTRDAGGDADAWIRFMAASLAAAPHAPVEKLAAAADEALAEYRARRAPGGLLSDAPAPAPAPPA
jgi:hypothetical protein